MSRAPLEKSDDVFWSVIQRCARNLYEASSSHLEGEEARKKILSGIGVDDFGVGIVAMCQHASKKAAEYYSGTSEEGGSKIQRDAVKAIAILAVLVRLEKVMTSEERSKLTEIIDQSKSYFYDITVLRGKFEKVIRKDDCTALSKETIMTVIEAMNPKDKFGGSLVIIEKIIERSKAGLKTEDVVEIYQRLAELFPKLLLIVLTLISNDEAAPSKERIMTVIEVMNLKNKLGGSVDISEKIAIITEIIESSEMELKMVDVVEIYQRLADLLPGDSLHDDKFLKVKRIIFEKIRNQVVGIDVEKDCDVTWQNDYSFSFSLKGVEASEIQRCLSREGFKWIKEGVDRKPPDTLWLSERARIGLKLFREAEGSDGLGLKFNLVPKIRVAEEVAVAEAEKASGGGGGSGGSGIESALDARHSVADPRASRVVALRADRVVEMRRGSGRGEEKL